jgi:hypothetical protein
MKASDAGLHRRLSGFILISLKLMKRTREDVANTIEGLINGTGRQWDWDGFTSMRLDDPELEAIRQRCVAIPAEFPPTTKTAYCSDAGLQVMRDLVKGLRAQPTGRS